MRSTRSRVAVLTGAPVMALTIALGALTVLPAHAGTLPAERPWGPPIQGPAKKSVTLTGAGWGHGVGMSQYGAYGMAKAGASAKQILTHYYPGITVSGVTDAVPISVNVLEKGRSLTLTPAQVSGGAGGVVLRLALAGVATPVQVPAGKSVSIAPSGKGFAVTVTGAAAVKTTGAITATWTGTKQLAGPATVIAMKATLSSGSAKSRSYRYGKLAISNVSGVRAVAVLDLHSEYLRGIAEVPTSWPAAVLQAQVVAARTYALRTMNGLKSKAGGVNASCGCQVWDDVRSQVYSGWKAESTSWTAAVQATSPSASTGLTALYAGKPIEAVYSSSTGGRTRNAADVWGSSVPYLRTATDSWSRNATINPKYAAWSRTLTAAAVAKAFGLPDVAKISVATRDSAGAVKSMRATSSSGKSATLTGEGVRSKLGTPSAWVDTVKLT